MRWISAIALACVTAIAGAEFRVATFEIDVTVPLGHALMGGGITPAKEVVDPLRAQGVVILGGDKPLVWLSIDWCEIRNDAYDEWRDALAEAANTDRTHVFLAAIHQHDAPVADFTAQAILDDVGLDKSLCDVSFVRECIERSATALTESLATAQPATHYGIGRATVQGVVSNRRVVGSDGVAHYSRTSSTPDPVRRLEPVGLVDDQVRTLSFWNNDTPLTAMHTFAIHPMSYYGRGGVSADFIGMARDKMQVITPEAKHLYFSGCSGDVIAGRYNDGGDYERVKLAERLFAAMNESWESTQKHPLTTIAFRNASMTLPLRDNEGFTLEEMTRTLNNDQAPIFQRNLAAMGLSWRARHEAGRAIDVPVADFGEALFLLMPAESFVGYQLEAQRIRPDVEVFVAGYGESAPGYIPTRDADAEGFVEAHTWCWVNRGSYATMKAAMIEALGPAAPWSALPAENGTIEIPAQEWPHEPGPRTINAYIHYPRGNRENITAETGLMLTLHNWGGTKAIGSPDPEVIADRYDVITIAVDYVMSGKFDVSFDPPYEFGYLQALDALRALYFVYDGLHAANIPFDAKRIYTTGGSGGGNVSLMANKLAPRTFAAVVDCSGMARLTDDIAYGYPAGSTLNAGYSKDATSTRYLSPDAQLLRDLAYLPHLETMKALGNTARVITLHGVDDVSCLFQDKRDMADVMKRVGLDVVPHFIGADEVDGEVFKNTGHSLGDRTAMLLHVAETSLNPQSETCARREGPTDFDHRDDQVRYEGPEGTYVISYEAGYPVGRFERRALYSYQP